MKRGRQKNPELVGVGKPKVETWLTASQKREARKIIKAGGTSWGVLQTDLVSALAVSRDSLRTAIEHINQYGEIITIENGRMFPNPMCAQRDKAISQICSISTKLGLSLTGTVGKAAKKTDTPGLKKFLGTPRKKKA